VPYLTILGTGSWTWGSTTYRAGTHEVDEDVAEAASRSSRKTLIVSDAPVRLAEQESGVLTREDIEGRVRGVKLAGVLEDEREEGESSADVSVPLSEVCMTCGRGFPSAGAREHHQRFAHGSG
jgi:hypothetical protein